ncbi:hypothetical protein KGQ19_45530 [Catenulispora sp. NL8]|uniref:PEGA domain-containing protein n=1 Tax=Catenulispora pinistramenti TaxID=2705254 RepID=A0ABS5L7F3_9ACTN|nr:hypothetical protein [Catenulispora pinistramenti]MBS2554140.1 hypothetical protein [Catenulispora pinistramenti]
MTTTLHLERAMPGATIAVQDRHASWSVLLDGQEVGRIASDETFQTQVPPGTHTLQLTSNGSHRSPVRTFAATDGSVVRFRCHSQPVWPLMVMAAVLPGRWIVLKQR